MTAPNIINITTINGSITYYTPSGTSAVVLLANAASSGHLYKINYLTVANIDGTNAVNATVSIYNNATVTSQGSAPSGGTAYAIASTVSVPANASLVVCNKTESFYLPEDKSIVITSSVASKLTFTVSYEDIS